MTEQMESRQAPIHAIESQMLGQPVLELIFPLQRMSTGMVGTDEGDLRCLGF
jgi:hypothetical protein